MYIYFDEQGVLKEIITESPFRVGDSKRNKIYIYWEGEHSPVNGFIKYRLPDKSETNETVFYKANSVTQMVRKTLPTDPVRNLKYFSYDHTFEIDGDEYVGYLFYEITVPDSVFNDVSASVLEPTENNLIVARVRFSFSDESIKTLGAIPFSVETNIGILTDNSINVSQYNYLITRGEDFVPFRLSILQNTRANTPRASILMYADDNGINSKISIRDLADRIIQTNTDIPSNAQEGQYIFKEIQ